MSSEPLCVRLIGKSNGVGLSRDFELLSQALAAAGCRVLVYGCERRDRKRRRGVFTRLSARLRRLRPASDRHVICDVNIMLEHVWPQFLHQARCNVLVPNPEWFDRRDLRFLDAIDRVWTKTALAERVFAERGCRTHPIGFDSEDRHDAGVERQTAFLHLAGRSPLKGTQRLLALWQRHPEWPPLTVVQDVPVGPAAPAANLRLEQGYLDDAALKQLQNAHCFHVCSSEAEGWGHYIAEAMSVRAVTLTCDAPPMNELVSAQSGLLVRTQAGAQQNLVRLALFDEAAMEAAVSAALRLSPAQQAAIGEAARAWFLANKQGFAARVATAVADLVESR